MVQVRSPDAVPAVRPVPARWGRVSRLLPAALVVLLAVALLAAGGVPLPDIGTFSAYVLLGLTLPGTLWWRALSGTPRSPAYDLAAGTALGYALEVLAYIPARWLDMPHAYVAWVGATYLLFVTVPGLRRHWTVRADPAGTPPSWRWAWTMAALVGFALVYSAATFFPGHGLTWPGNGAPYIDMPYHLAMAGDVKHHVPAMFPNVAGEALHDHWFVYADLAATSWTTGLELQTLLYRLSPIPMIAAFTVLVAAIAHRMTGHRWSGIAAVAVMSFVIAPDPYTWNGGITTTAGDPAPPWISPTQTFGTLLFTPLTLVLIDLLRRPHNRPSPHNPQDHPDPHCLHTPHALQDPHGVQGPRDPQVPQDSEGPCRPAAPHGLDGRWVLVAVLLLAEAGAKATFLPLALAGVTLVLILHLIAHRTSHRAPHQAFHRSLRRTLHRALHHSPHRAFYRAFHHTPHRPLLRAAAGLVVLCGVLLAFAQVVLFHGEDKGLRLSPLHFMRWHEAYRIPDGAALLHPGRAEPFALVLVVVAIHVVSWAALWGGAALALRRWRTDPAVVLLAGIGAAGIGATCVFGHPGLSQGYFLTSAAPYLTILTITALTPRPQAPIPAAPSPAVTGRVPEGDLPVGGRALGAVAGRAPGRGSEVVGRFPGRKWVWGVVLGAGVLAVQGVRVWGGGVPPQGAGVVAGRVVPYVLLVGAAVAVAAVLVLAGRRGHVWWAVPVFALGYGLGTGVPQRLEAFRNVPSPTTLQIPDGGTEAARWLRDHSSPGTLVAVNAHCRAPSGTCDSRHFWISAYAERRILVEGWGYINGANSQAALLGRPTMGMVPFRYPERLADNDAAFLHPTQETVGRLRDVYGVRWLFTDDRYPVRTSALERVAVLRFQAGHCRVYDLERAVP